MNLHKTKLLIAISVCLLVVASAFAFTKSRKTNSLPSTIQQEKQQTVDTLPLIISQVKDLEAVKASLKNPGTSNATAVLEIKNKSKKPVIALSVEIGKPEEASGVTTNGFNGSDEPPDVVIEPQGTITVELSLNNAKPGEPIRISGVMYADNSEDGDKTALETIRAQRKHSKAGKLKSGSSPKTKIK